MPRPPITNHTDAIAVMLGDPDERLIQTHTPEGTTWHLERDRRAVAPAVVALLRHDAHTAIQGHLVAVVAGLLPDADLAQAYAWRRPTFCDVTKNTRC